MFWVQHYRSARRSLQDVSAFAKEVVASLPVGLIATDHESRVAFFNGAAENITGTTLAAHRGQPLETLLADHGRPLQQRLAQGERVIEEAFEWPLADGRRIPLSLSATHILNEEGRFVGNVLILRDLAEIRALQQEVRQKEKLAAIGGLAAGVAHEIRNPLSSIKGLASYFRQKLGPNPEDQEAARVMIEEVDRLNRAITTLLDFARPSELKVVPTSVCDLLRRSLKLIEQDAETRGIHLSSDCTLNATQPVELDADRFTQCLLNLYLNAIQAMRPGGRLYVQARMTEKRELIVAVSDTGPGISAAMQSQIFDPYFTTKPRGVGLGLAVVHKIVEAHHGHISCHSTPGTGARFEIRLPAAQPPETAAHRTAPAGGLNHAHPDPGGG
jgi:two-component system sensor histidine kinase HydH